MLAAAAALPTTKLDAVFSIRSVCLSATLCNELRWSNSVAPRIPFVFEPRSGFYFGFSTPCAVLCWAPRAAATVLLLLISSSRRSEAEEVDAQTRNARPLLLSCGLLGTMRSMCHETTRGEPLETR